MYIKFKNFKRIAYLSMFFSFLCEAQTVTINMSGTADNTIISANSFDGGNDNTVFEKDGFQFFGDDNNDGVPSSSQILYYNATSTGVGTTGGFFNSATNYDAETRFVIKKTDGNEFDFQSVVVTEWSAFYTPIIFEAYKDGILIGSQSVNNAILSEFTVSLNTIFDNVDEVRIHSPGGFGEQFSYDNFMFEINSLSVHDFDSERELNIYPNPSSDYIKISKLLNETTYIIYNVRGTEIVRRTIAENGQINVQNLTSGLYFLKVNGSTVRFIKK